MWNSPLLLDSIVLFAVVAICLLIGIQFGVKRPWWRFKPEPPVIRNAVLIIIVGSLIAVLAWGVISGHGDDVRQGAIQGAWGGGLLGAWLATRKHEKRLNTVGEAFADGLAETLDGALIGTVVGAFLLNAAQSWQEGFLGAAIGVGGFAFGRLRLTARSDAPIPRLARMVVNALRKPARLGEATSQVRVSILTTVLEALGGALFGAGAMSLFWAAVSWWVGLPEKLLAS